MTAESRKVRARIKDTLQDRSIPDLRKAIAPDFSRTPPRIRNAASITSAAVGRRWDILHAETQADLADRNALLDACDLVHMPAYGANIENFVGTVKVPLGVLGPLRVNGVYAKGDYYVPLATTEAALVASYHRGAGLISEGGGCSALLLSEGVSRSPCFSFASLYEVGRFIIWVSARFNDLKRIAEGTTRHGKLLEVRTAVEGNNCYLTFEFSTGDAAGQNMVTIATQAVCAHIAGNSPVKARSIAIEANISGDKKASFASFVGVRGKKVAAEVVLPAALVEKHLHTTVAAIDHQWRIGVVGSVMSGTIGAQSHYANGLAALFIATGQDAACVSEAAVGITRLEKTSEGDLYAAVTLPNLIVGAVGGGTGLPSQSACRRIAATDNAREFAELCAALCLAGELSLIGAVCAGDFSRAHQKLARGRNQTRAADGTRSAAGTRD